MAAVVGFLVISFAVWGIGDIFRGFGRSTVAKIGAHRDHDRAVPQPLQRAAAAICAAARPPDQRGAGAGARAWTGCGRTARLRDPARRARSRARPRRCPMPRSPSRSPPTLRSRARTAQFDRFRFEQIIRNAGYTEARFVAEQRRRLMRRQLAGTISSGLSAPKALVEAANRYQNEQRSIEYVLLDRAQAGEIPAPDAGGARQVFRGAQDPVPRARIPQARDRVADPERAGALDRDFRCRPQARLRRAARPLRHARSGATSSRSIFPMPRRRAPPPTASPKARPSSTSPRSSARPRRTSTSARWPRPA